MTVGQPTPGDSRRAGTPPDGGAAVPPVTPVPAVPPKPATAPRAAPVPDEPSTIGRVLGAARLAAGLTVEQVSTSTRIRVPIVHAIEHDDFSRCGGDFYARGHVRAIARTVGADADTLVAWYDREHGGAPKPQLTVPSVYEEERRSQRLRPNWAAAMVAAIVVVVAVIGFNLISGRSKGAAEAGTGPSQASTGAASPSPSTSPSTQPPAPTASAIAAAPAGKVTVKIVAAAGNSWLSVVNSGGSTLYQSVLTRGRTRTFTDGKKIRLVIGNAGAVRLYVNGKDLGPAGSDGQVVSVSYTPGNPQAG